MLLELPRYPIEREKIRKLNSVTNFSLRFANCWSSMIWSWYIVLRSIMCNQKHVCYWSGAEQTNENYSVVFWMEWHEWGIPRGHHHHHLLSLFRPKTPFFRTKTEIGRSDYDILWHMCPDGKSKSFPLVANGNLDSNVFKFCFGLLYVRVYIKPNQWLQMTETHQDGRGLNTNCWW